MWHFDIRRRRKVGHCLMFEPKSPNSPSTSRERTAMFQTTQADSSQSANGTRHSENFNWRMGDTANGVVYEGHRMSVKIIEAKRLVLRRRIVEETLARRRNAICSEVERDWFGEGCNLEKHRHNLQVTLELKARGLMMW